MELLASGPKCSALLNYVFIKYLLNEESYETDIRVPVRVPNFRAYISTRNIYHCIIRSFKDNAIYPRLPSPCSRSFIPTPTPYRQTYSIFTFLSHTQTSDHNTGCDQCY
jgi:hypothetical protein